MRRLVPLLLVALLGAAVASGAAVAAGPAGVAFKDPEGDYRLTIPSSGWTSAHGSFAKGVEVWFVAPRKNGFTPNVNVLTQTVPARTTVEQYLKASIQNAPSLLAGFGSIGSRIVARGSVRLGVWEYRSAQGGRAFRHLGVFTIDGTRAIVVTLTATAALYPALRAAILPYLLTLQPTPGA